MSGDPKRSPFHVAGLGCGAVYGLVVVVLLVTVLVWRSTIADMVAQAQKERELYAADTKLRDAFRARTHARSGLEVLLATLRSGAQPKSPLKGTLRMSYDGGMDGYVTEFSETDGVYTVKVTGQVTMGDWRSFDSEEEKVVGECVLEARVKVADGAVTVLDESLTDATPAPR